MSKVVGIRFKEVGKIYYFDGGMPVYFLAGFLRRGKLQQTNQIF